MDLRFFLTMTDVSIEKETTTYDGMGGFTSTVVTTILPSAIIYQEGSTSVFKGFRTSYADKITQESSHILICNPLDYTWTIDDRRVKQGGRIFTIVGTPYNIMGFNEVMMIGLKEQV